MTDTPIIPPPFGSGASASDAPPPSKVMIVSLTHPSQKPFNLDAGNLSIGRDPAADIFIDNPDVSRLHAMLRAAGNKVEVVDARSTHGTFLNGAKIDRAVVRYGDVLRVGNEELKVVPRTTLEIEPPSGPIDSGALAVNQTVEEAMRLLAEERRQLAILYTMAIRFLETSAEQHPVDLFFAMLDRVVSFDAAFIIIGVPKKSLIYHHPAGLKLKTDDIARLIRDEHGEQLDQPKAFDGHDDAISLSTYRARSRAIIPLGPGGSVGCFGLLAGVSDAYSVQLDFLVQLGRILSAALVARGDEATV